MATWIRSFTADLTGTVDIALAGPADLSSDTAPGDFDPAAVNSVRFQFTLSHTGTFATSGSDSFALQPVEIETTGGTQLANISPTGTIQNGTATVAIDLTDATPNVGASIADWSGARFNGVTANAVTNFTQTKGPDGVTPRILAASVTITIDYTLGTPSRAATINTGGGISTTVSADHSVTASVRTGGNISTTAVRGNLLTSFVSLGMAASTPYYDALDVWIRWRVSSASLAGVGSNIAWSLREGATFIAGGNFADIASTSLINSFASLTSGEAASIGNWSNLALRISFDFPQGSGYGYMEVADAWLSIPATVGDPSRTGELNTGGGLTATVTHDASKTGTIRSGGGITATAAKRATRTGTIRTGPNLTATVAGDHANASVINGGGSITATFTASVSRTGLIRSGGGISVSVANERSTSGTINSGGSIAAATTRTANTSGTLNGGGRILPSLGANIQTSGTVNTGGGITSTVLPDHATSGTLNTGGGVDTTTAKRPSSSAQVRGGGRLVPALGSSRSVAASVRSGGSITATAIKQGGNPQRAATLNSGGGLSATVAPERTTSGSMNSGGNISATTSATHGASAAVNGGGGVSAQTSGIHAVTGLTRAGGGIDAAASQGVVWTDLELTFGPIDDPLSNRLLPHYVNFRYASATGTNARVDWWLMCGTTEVASGLLLTATTAPVDAHVELTQGEVDLITDYSDMRIRLERTDGFAVLHVLDIWFEVPLVGNPYASVSINAGGGITATTTGTHIVEAFPSPANAMLGPAMQSGGGISAITGIPPGGRQGLLRTGGGIEPTVTSTRSVAVSLRSGGRIVASTNEAVVSAALRTGGTFRYILESLHATSATMRGGGGINTASTGSGYIVPGGGVVSTLPPATGRPRPRPGSGAILMPGPPGVRPQRNHGDVEH